MARRSSTNQLMAVLGAAAVSLLAPSAVSAGIFGTNPINISGGGHADGESGSPAISGDNRKTRYVAFYSDATNLVGGDSNGKRDIFLWSRPKGRKGLTLPHGAGSLKRVSVNSAGNQANGDSFNPSLDGSATSTPHCVAFQSVATNLAGADRDGGRSDIFVRDLRTRKTILVSRGIKSAASDPSIDGHCSNVAYLSGGRILVQGVRAGGARQFGIGREPNFSRDGSAVTWVQGKNVMVRRNGRKSVVGPGENPTVTDNEGGQWAVSYQTGGHVVVRVVKGTGGPKRTMRVGPGSNGGITLYGSRRGIVTFFDGSDYYYFNEHSGNSDDIAHMDDVIDDAATSARANFVAFSSGGNVWFKHLVDGEAI